MSRIAKSPVLIPKGLDVEVGGQTIKVKGSQGVATCPFPELVDVKLMDNVLSFAPRIPSKKASALAGTIRALVSNMVQGVMQGFEKKLSLVGVGYRVQVEDKWLILTLGYSHPVRFKIPDDITIETPSQTSIVVKGIDKQRVGQVAADIRAYRKPEPYKGKGVRYADEVVVIKEAKKK